MISIRLHHRIIVVHYYHRVPLVEKSLLSHVVWIKDSVLQAASCGDRWKQGLGLINLRRRILVCNLQLLLLDMYNALGS